MQQLGVFMEKIFNINCPLFFGINKNDLGHLLTCMGAKLKQYKKNEYIIMEGEVFNNIFIVATGNCQVIKNDFWGNRSIITNLSAGDLFGESFASGENNTSKVSVIASCDCSVLILKYNKVTTTCPSSCIFHNTLIKNMLKILGNKNLILTEKIEFLSQRTIREKLLAYFSTLAKQSGTKIEVPFSRQELADFLSIDRSALSRELSNMQNDGILSFEKNHFVLNKTLN